jgi:hypothetical protein
MMEGYQSFLASKHIRSSACGFDVDEGTLPMALFDWQRRIVVWALRRGRAALFTECGTGKTLLQCAWAAAVCRHTGGDVLILAPLAVAQQTVREAARFGITVTRCREQSDVRPGINVANYERLSHFDAAAFVGVVLDESGILKSYMGKTKRALVDAFRTTRYKLCCTATPAPNDHIELGNHSEFLGVMPSNEMLSRWFINDTERTGVYMIKGHAAADFWAWVASWSVALRRPSDLGYPDDGFVLPPLQMRQVTVRVDMTDPTGERLFRMPELNATKLHQEMRLTAAARVQAAADLVNGNDETWIVWCHTNDEADRLVRMIPEAIEVRGAETPESKEQKLVQFSEERARVIISKPSLAGFGLNWQHCHNVVFVGMSYSFEELYQAVRRSWRFKQEHPVNVYLIVAETEGEILATVQKKMAGHEEMLDALIEATKVAQGRGDLLLTPYDPREEMVIPHWLRSVA